MRTAEQRMGTGTASGRREIVLGVLLLAGSLGGFLASVDFSLPIPLRAGTGDPLRLTWDFGYRWLADDLTFLARNDALRSVDDEWQLSAALAPRSGRVRIGPFSFEQIGLTYGFSSDGEFRAVTLNFNAPLSR